MLVKASVLNGPPLTDVLFGYLRWTAGYEAILSVFRRFLKLLGRPKYVLHVSDFAP